MIAWLERDIGRGSLCLCACCPQRVDLSVGHSGLWREGGVGVGKVRSV